MVAHKEELGKWQIAFWLMNISFVLVFPAMFWMSWNTMEVSASEDKEIRKVCEINKTDLEAKQDNINKILKDIQIMQRDIQVNLKYIAKNIEK